MGRCKIPPGLQTRWFGGKMSFPAFIAQKQERAAALAPSAAVCPVDLKWEERRDFLPGKREPGDRAVAPHRDPKCQGSPVAQQPERRGCHLALPAVRSQVSARFGAVPAPPDASRCRSQARHKVHALRRGIGDKCPQGSGGVTVPLSPRLCHRRGRNGPGVPWAGSPRLPALGDVRMLRARSCRQRPARPRCDIDCW